MAATLISCGAFVLLAVKWPPHTRRVSRITVKALVTSNIIQSVCLVGKRRLKERCGLEPRTNIFFRLRNRQKLVRIIFWCGLDWRIYGTSKRHIDSSVPCYPILHSPCTEWAVRPFGRNKQLSMMANNYGTLKKYFLKFQRENSCKILHVFLRKHKL